MTGPDIRFRKYSALTNSKENEPLTHDMLIEMFGDDARANSTNKNIALRIAKAQIEFMILLEVPSY